MKVAMFIDNSDAVNWGGQATAAGLKRMIQLAHPEAEVSMPAIGPLPWGKIKPVMRWRNRRLGRTILEGNLAELDAFLGRMAIDLGSFDSFDRVCFNGEGLMHSRSGHLYRFMGMLRHAIERGTYVAAVNQTIDIAGDEMAEAVVGHVYGRVDRLAVREPVSVDALRKLGLEPELIPDAAYAVPIMSDAETAERRARFNLSDDYWCLTGSSIFRHDQKAVSQLEGVAAALEAAAPSREIVHMANTTADRWVAERVVRKRGGRIIDYRDAKYMDAKAVIAGARALIGGRQHPIIFAAMYGTPFLALGANTHKMQGVIELLRWGLPVVSWDEPERLPELLARLEEAGDLLEAMKVPAPVALRLERS